MLPQFVHVAKRYFLQPSTSLAADYLRRDTYQGERSTLAVVLLRVLLLAVEHGHLLLLL